MNAEIKAAGIYKQRIVSADAHVLEPPDLWTSRMDKKWRATAPRIETLDETGDFIIIDGMRPRPLAFEGPMADLKKEGLAIPKPKGYKYWDSIRPGCYEPGARMLDQDEDGVSGEVIYPGVGLFMVEAPDADYQYAACRAYNDWLAEFCGAYPDRLKGMGLVPTRTPVEDAVAEMHRIRKLGLTGVTLPAWCPDRPFNLPDWDPLWAAMQDTGTIAALHLGGGKPTFGRAHGPGAGGIIVCLGKFDLNEPMQQIIWGGVPMRFPKMRWGLIEGGIGWIASALTLMDHWWNDHKGWMQPRLEEPPSFYFKRNFFATFEDDRPGILTREYMGVENLMWGNDYPHTEGVWPFSRRQIFSDFAEIPEGDTRKIVHDNVVREFGFPAR